MSFQKCNACGGIYQDPQPDGTAYFHVCPEVENKAYQPDATQANYDPRITVPRADARDENLIPGLQFSDNKLFVFEPDRNDPAITNTRQVKDAAKRQGAGRTKIA